MKDKKTIFRPFRMLLLCFIMLVFIPVGARAEDSLPWKGAKTIYPVYLNQGKMVQLDWQTYYYTFTPEKAGKYTFYLEEGASYAYLNVYDETGATIDPVGSPDYYGTRYPAGYTVNLDGDTTYYISANGESASASKTNLCVTEYAQQEIKVSSITPDKNPVSAGESVTLDIALDKTNISGAYAKLRSDDDGYSSNSVTYPKASDGHIELEISGLQDGRTYTVYELILLDEHGIPYTFSDDSLNLSTVSLTVSGLQDTLDELAAQGGGDLKLDYYTYIEEALTVPEAVTLELAGGLNLSAPLTIKGTVKVTDGSVYARDGASLNKEGAGVFAIYRNDVYIYKNDEGNYTLNHEMIDAGYGLTVEYIDGESYQWRHGKWREPIQSGQVPDEDEITDIDASSFSESFSSQEEYRDEAWYRFTVPSDWNKARISLAAELDSGRNAEIEIRNADNNTVLKSLYVYSDSSELSTLLSPGSTYYIRLDMYNGRTSISFSGECSDQFMSAEELADYIHFDNASLSVEDAENPAYKKVTISIPVALEFPEDVSRLELGYTGDIYYYTFNGERNGNVLLFEQEIEAISVQEEELSYQLNRFECRYNDTWYYIHPGTDSNDGYQEISVDMPETLTSFKLSPLYLEPAELSLGMEPVALTQGSKSAFHFKAEEEGTYTFYLTGEGYNREYRVNEDSRISYYTGWQYPHSITETLEVDEEIYFIAEPYYSEQECAIGVTADTGQVEVESISLSGTDSAVTNGSSFRIDVSTTGNPRQIWANFGSRDSSRSYGYMANADTTWGNPETGTYSLESLEVIDEYGRSRTFYDKDLDQIDFSTITIKAMSLSDWLAAQKAEGNTDQSLESLSLGDGTLIIPEGMTLSVDNMDIYNSMKVQVYGTLNVKELHIGDRAKISREDSGAIYGLRISTSDNSIYDIELLKDIILGSQKGARMRGYQDGQSKALTWDGAEWKEARDDGMPNPNEMNALAIPDKDGIDWSEVGEPISNEWGYNEYWYKRTMEESGSYEVELSDTDESGMTIYIYADGSYHELGWRGTGLYLEAGEMICVRVYTETELPAKIRLKKAESALSAEDLARAVDIEKADLTVTDNQKLQCNEVSVSIPVTDPDDANITRGWLYLADEDGEESFSISLNREDDVLTGSQKISYSQQTEDADYHISSLQLYSGTDTYGDNDWESYYTIYYNQSGGESSVKSGYITSAYVQAENLPTCSLKFTGPVELFTDKDVEIPLHTSVRIKFTPKETGSYVIFQDNDHVWNDADSGWVDEDGEEFWNQEFAEGATYYTWLYYYDEEDETAPETVSVRMMLDNEVPEVTAVTLPDTISYQQIVPFELTAQSENDVKQVSLGFRNAEPSSDEYDDAEVYISVNDFSYKDGKISGSMYIDEYWGVASGDKLQLSSVSIRDKYGKYNNIYGEELEALAGSVTNFIDWKEAISKGGSLAFNSLYMSDNSLTIPSAANVTCYRLTIEGASQLAIDGTLTIKESFYLNNPSAISKGTVLIDDYANVPGKEDLDHLAGTYTDARAWVDEEETYYYWNGKEWKAEGQEDPDDERIDISEIEFALEKDSFAFTGEKICPAVTSVSGLVEGEDYDVSYDDNLDPTTEAVVTISGIGKYKGSQELFFTIEKGTGTLNVSLSGADKGADGSYTAAMGAEPKLDARISHNYNADLVSGTFTYESSNSAIASVDKNGKVALKNKGTVTLTVNCTSKQLDTQPVTVTLTVIKGSASITVEKTSISVYKSSTGTVDLGASTNSDAALSYQSSDTEVADVDTKGTVTLKKAGTALITISAGETDLYEAAEDVTVEVTVKEGRATIKLNQKTVNLGTEGSADAAYDVVKEELFTISEGANLHITIGDESVVTYDETSHELRGHAAGETTLTAYAENEEKGIDSSAEVTFTVRVYEPIVKVEGGDTYISVSSALSAIFDTDRFPAADDPKTLILLADTPQSEILHKASDLAEIKEGRSVILNLAGKNYNGALRIYGTLRLRNVEESKGRLLSKVKRALAKAASIEALIDDANFRLAGGTGTLVIESTEEINEETIQKNLSGDSAKLETTGTEGASTITYYAAVEAAVEDANKMEGTDPATVTLTNDSVIKENMELGENVTLDLNGNRLSSEALDAQIKGSGTIDDSAGSQDGQKTLIPETLVADTVKVNEEAIEKVAIPKFSAGQAESYTYDGKSPAVTVLADGEAIPEEGYVSKDGYTYIAETAGGYATAGTHTYKATIYRKNGSEKTPVDAVLQDITIQPLAITVADLKATAANRSYQAGNVFAEVEIAVTNETLAALLEADGLALSGFGSFENDMAGKDKTVTVSGIRLVDSRGQVTDESNLKMKNYSLGEINLTAAAAINRAVINEDTAVSDLKVVYDGEAQGIVPAAIDGASSNVVYSLDGETVDKPVEPGEYAAEVTYTADSNHIFPEDKETVTAMAKLTIEKTEEMEAADKAAQDVIEKAAQIPELEASIVEDQTSFDKAGDAIKNAQDALDKITDEQMTQMSKAQQAKFADARSNIANAQTTFADMTAAKSVIDQIKDINNDELTVNDQAKLADIQNAYENLNADQKKYVSDTIQKKLESAQATVTQKVTAAEDAKKAEEAEAARKAAEAAEAARKAAAQAEAARQAAEAEKARQAAQAAAALNPTTALSAYETPVILAPKKSKTVTVLVTARDNSKVSTDTASVVSSKTKIAKVSGQKLAAGKLTFKVKGLKAGKSVITVKVGARTVKVKVTVAKKANAAKSAKASKKAITVKANKTASIVIKVDAKDKKQPTTDAITAKSGKAAVASVTSIATAKGKVTVKVKGLKKGKSTLTIKAGKKKAKVTVNVK